MILYDDGRASDSSHEPAKRDGMREPVHVHHVRLQRGHPIHQRSTRAILEVQTHALALDRLAMRRRLHYRCVHTSAHQPRRHAEQRRPGLDQDLGARRSTSLWKLTCTA